MSRRSLGMSTVPRLVNALVTAPLAVVPIEVAMAERTAFNPSDLGTCESTIELLQRCHATLQNPGVGCDALQADLRTRAVSRSIRSISVRSLGSINSIRSIHACCFVLAMPLAACRHLHGRLLVGNCVAACRHLHGFDVAACRLPTSSWPTSSCAWRRVAVGPTPRYYYLLLYIILLLDIIQLLNSIILLNIDRQLDKQTHY